MISDFDPWASGHQLENVMRRNKELEFKNEQNEHFLAQTRIDLDKLQAKIEVLQEKNEILEMRNLSNSEKISKSKNHEDVFINRYESKIAQQNHQIDSFAKQNMNLEKQKEEIQRELFNEREKLSKVEELLKKSHSTKAYLSKRLDGQLANNQQLIKEMHNLKIKRTSMIEISPLVENHLKDLNDECEYYRNENHNLLLTMETIEPPRRNCSKESRRSSSISRDYEKTKHERDNLRNMVGRLEHKMSQINSNIAGLTTEYDGSLGKTISVKNEEKIQELMSRLRNEKERFYKSEKENEKLRNQLIHAVEKIKKIKYQEEIQLRNNSAERRKNEMQHILAQKDEEIFMLRGEIENFEDQKKQRTDKMGNKLAMKEQQIIEIIKQNSEIKEEMSRLVKQVNQKEEEIYFLNKKSQMWRETFGYDFPTWQDEAQIHKNLMQNIKSYREEVQRLTEIEQEYNFLSNEVTNLRQERCNWERDRKTLTLEIENCRQTEKELGLKLNCMAEDTQNYLRLVGDLETKLADENYSQRELAKKVAGLEEEKTALNEKLQSHAELISNLQTERDKIQNLLHDKSNSLNKLEEELQDQAIEVEEFKRQLQIGKDKLDDVNQTLDANKQSKIHQELKIEEKQSKIRTMEERINLMNTRNCDLIRDLRISRDTCNELESDLRKMRKDLSWHKLQRNRAESELRKHGWGIKTDMSKESF